MLVVGQGQSWLPALTVWWDPCSIPREQWGRSWVQNSTHSRAAALQLPLFPPTLTSLTGGKAFLIQSCLHSESLWGARSLSQPIMTLRVSFQYDLSAFCHFIFTNPLGICARLVLGFCKQISIPVCFLPSHWNDFYIPVFHDCGWEGMRVMGLAPGTRGETVK